MVIAIDIIQEEDEDEEADGIYKITLGWYNVNVKIDHWVVNKLCIPLYPTSSRLVYMVISN